MRQVENRISNRSARSCSRLQRLVKLVVSHLNSRDLIEFHFICSRHSKRRIFLIIHSLYEVLVAGSDRTSGNSIIGKLGEQSPMLGFVLRNPSAAPATAISACAVSPEPVVSCRPEQSVLAEGFNGGNLNSCPLIFSFHTIFCF